MQYKEDEKKCIRIIAKWFRENKRTVNRSEATTELGVDGNKYDTLIRMMEHNGIVKIISSVMGEKGYAVAIRPTPYAELLEREFDEEEKGLYGPKYKEDEKKCIRIIAKWFRENKRTVNRSEAIKEFGVDDNRYEVLIQMMEYSGVVENVQSVMGKNGYASHFRPTPYAEELARELDEENEGPKKSRAYGEGTYGEGVYGGEKEDEIPGKELEDFREAFIKFLREKKGWTEIHYENENYKTMAIDLSVRDPKSKKLIAVINFKKNIDGKIESKAEASFAQYAEFGVGKYLVTPSSEKSNYSFTIYKYSDRGLVRIQPDDFPDYEGPDPYPPDKNFDLFKFRIGLDYEGSEICDKIIDLAANIGLYAEDVDESYANFRLTGSKKTDNVAVQIHKYGEYEKTIALAVVGPRKGTEWKEPELNDFITKGQFDKLSVYKIQRKNIPAERAWLNGNLPKTGVREKAGVYVIKPEILENPDAWSEVEGLLKLAKENAEKVEGGEEDREMSADEFYVSDGKTKKDLLGFMPYVKAVAAFLTHARTQPPLTMSVEGEWGSGKSSFMLQLQDEIKRIYTEQGKKKCFIVEFEPWRHDKDEALWAAFVLTFLKKIRGQFYELRRWRGDFKLFWSRFKWEQGWIDVVRCFALWITFVLLSIGLIWLTLDHGLEWVSDFCENVLEIAKEAGTESENSNGSKEGIVLLLKVLLGGGGLAAVASGIISLFKLVMKVTGNPLKINLKKYLKHPDYADRVSFIDKLHNDFQKIVSAYTGKERVYIFIDDLDRCVIPKAAELMESINLMLSNNPKLVFILGMDREKVAAGLAVKHEKLLPYLSGWAVGGEVTDKDYDKTKRIKGIRYGYSFIEKFIQVPFMLPIPRQDRIKEMLLELAGQGSSSKSESKVRNKIGLLSKFGFAISSVFKTAYRSVLKRFSKQKPDTVESKPPLTEVEKEEQIIEAKVGEAVKKVFGDDENFRHIVQMVSPYLKYNPRRVKQFVNLFRLRYVTAVSTNLFEQEDGKQLTFEQLGKFVGIGLGWPLFIKDLERNYKLLDTLVDIAEGKETDETDERPKERAKEWAEDEQLIGLLKSGCSDEKEQKKTEGERKRYSMRGLEVERLMKVAPRIKQMDELEKRTDD